MKILYSIFLFFVFILRKLPKFLRRGFFKLIANLAFIFARKTNKIIEANLRLVYGDNLSKNEIIEIQKYSYFNMVLWVQTLIENLDASNEEIKSHVKMENEHILDELTANNEPFILISAHYGNMEMMSTYLNKFKFPINQVARQSNFKEFDDFITNAREKSGAKIVYRHGALKKLVKALIKKEVVSLIIDQNINPKDGDEVEFLGVKANQTSSSSSLARKFKVKIVPIAIFNEDDYNYKIKVYDPIVPVITQNEQEDLDNLSQAQANALSDIINEDKKQWFWPHKRFKSHFREIYEKNSNIK